MKGLLFRGENLLLILPPLLFFLIELLIGNKAMDIHLHDTYYVVANHTALLFTATILFLLIIPYFFHFLLRIKQKRNKWICAMHILLTIILLFSFLFMLADNTVSVEPGWHTTIYPPGFSPFVFVKRFLSIIWLLFLPVQLIFIMYAVVRLARKVNQI